MCVVAYRKLFYYSSWTIQTERQARQCEDKYRKLFIILYNDDLNTYICTYCGTIPSHSHSMVAWISHGDANETHTLIKSYRHNFLHTTFVMTIGSLPNIFNTSAYFLRFFFFGLVLPELSTDLQMLCFPSVFFLSSICLNPMCKIKRHRPKNEKSTLYSVYFTIWQNSIDAKAMSSKTSEKISPMILAKGIFMNDIHNVESFARAKPNRNVCESAFLSISHK